MFKEKTKVYVNAPSNALEHTQPLLSTDDPECSYFPETVSFMPDDDRKQTIDNTTLTYVPICLPCGVRVLCAPAVLSGCPMVLRTLQTDLVQCLKLLPWPLHALIKRTSIWVNASYSYGPKDDPRILRHSTAHHQEGWLIHCARDIPEKARSIEIYSCYDYERMRLHWNGCGLLLHELCHLIHQFALPDGLDNETVKELYEEARNSGLYEHTLRRDWAGQEEDYDMAYCMVDHKEFFAEMSVTYLSDGYRSLDKEDKMAMESCCPPLLQPSVTDRVLNQRGIIDEPTTDEQQCWWWLPPQRTPKIRIVDPMFQETALARSCKGVVHCNKFYPFTKGQLRYHDPATYKAMHGLWREIFTRWNDVDDDSFCGKSLRAFSVFC